MRDVAELQIPPPNFPKRESPELFIRGIRYQRRVEKAIGALGLGAKFHFGIWLPGPLQPDIILEFTSSLILIETKLSACDCSVQLTRYTRALAPTGKLIWAVQVARNAAPGFFPTSLSLLDLSLPYELVAWRL